MGAEGQPYTPEEVIETEGSNRGNVTDEKVPAKVIDAHPTSTQKVGDKGEQVDLPMVGALAEAKDRRSFGHKYDKFEESLGRLLHPEARTTGYSADERADFAGDQAISDEIYRRAFMSEQAKDLSPEARKEFAEKARLDFRVAQKRETDARVAEELKEK